MRGILADATEFLVIALVDLMAKLLAIEAYRIRTVFRKVSLPITPATCVCLSIMGKTNQEFTKSEVRWNGFMYANPKMTIAVKNHLVRLIAATTIANYLAIRLQTLDDGIIR